MGCGTLEAIILASHLALGGQRWLPGESGIKAESQGMNGKCGAKAEGAAWMETGGGTGGTGQRPLWVAAQSWCLDLAIRIS